MTTLDGSKPHDAQFNGVDCNLAMSNSTPQISPAKCNIHIQQCDIHATQQRGGGAKVWSRPYRRDASRGFLPPGKMPRKGACQAA